MGNKFGETELIEVKLQSFSGFKCMIFISKVEIKYGVFPRIIGLWNIFFFSQWRILLRNDPLHGSYVV